MKSTIRRCRQVLAGAPVIRYGIVNETTGELEQFNVQVQYEFEVLTAPERRWDCTFGGLSASRVSTAQVLGARRRGGPPFHRHVRAHRRGLVRRAHSCRPILGCTDGNGMALAGVAMAATSSAIPLRRSGRYAAF